MSVGVGRMFESICLSVCLFVCLFLEHNSKTNDFKVFKLGVANDLGYPRSGTVLEFKGLKSVGLSRPKFILHTRTLLEPC